MVHVIEELSSAGVYLWTPRRGKDNGYENACIKAIKALERQLNYVVEVRSYDLNLDSMFHDTSLDVGSQHHVDHLKVSGTIYAPTTFIKPISSASDSYGTSEHGYQWGVTFDGAIASGYYDWWDSKERGSTRFSTTRISNTKQLISYTSHVDRLYFNREWLTYFDGNESQEWDCNWHLHSGSLSPSDLRKVLCQRYSRAYFREKMNELNMAVVWSDVEKDIISQFTPCDTNSLANIYEGLSAIKDLASNIYNISKGKLPKAKRKSVRQTIQDGWLGYRYTYCTTLSDYREYCDHLDEAIETFNGQYRKSTHSSKSFSLSNGVRMTATMTVNATPRIPNGFSEAWLQLSSFGLAPNLTNIWDVIPFSFMIDWFTSIGDTCSTIDAYCNLNQLQLKIDYVISSIHCTYHDMEYDLDISWYERTPSLSLPLLTVESTYDPSTKTWIKRAADATSIFVR